MLVSLGLSVERVANLGVGGGGEVGVSIFLISSTAIHRHSISQHFFGWWTMHRARKGPLGFHIQFQEVGAQSLVRGVLKGGKGGGAKVRHSTVRTGTGISRGRVREGGKDPPFGT